MVAWNESTWYGSSAALNYNKPIIAESTRDGRKYLLLPQMISNGSSYEVIGFNWFDISMGRYNSKVFYKTAQEAISSYGSYKIYNAELSVSRTSEIL